jgi:hypothetical protein
MEHRWGRPQAASAEPWVSRDERVLSRAITADGHDVVATDHALYLPETIRIGWERVEHAAWREGVLSVWELVVDDEEPRAHHVRLAEPRALPETVRERVRASIVISHHVPLRDRLGVRVVARRAIGKDDVTWMLVFDSELDPNDPGLRAAAEQALEQIRRQTGV